MKHTWQRLVLTATAAVLAGCSSSPTATPMPPTATSALPTATPLPTLPPVAIGRLIPPQAIPLEPTVTVCASGCDFGTIRDALAAPTTADGAIIEVQDAIHTESGIVVRTRVTIQGTGASHTVVQAHDSVDEAQARVFLIEEGATTTIQGLTIRHGKPSEEADHGGGILNHGTLTLRDCVVTGNVAGGGGGIANNGELTVINCSIHHNTAVDVGPAGRQCGSGGGILSRTGVLTVINSTVHDNRAGTRSRGTGGGVRIGCGCDAVIANSTVSGNQSVRYGAGIALQGNLRVIHCTVSDNATTAQGAGIYVGHRLDMENTLIVNNHGSGGECAIQALSATSGAGAIGINRGNWIADGSCEPDFAGDPELGPLADNGGETWTHALLPGSGAIDALATAACTLPIDQRGMGRPVSVANPRTPCDIGAFELQQ